MSDILHVPVLRPGYGKLHVGIYILALEDALRRRKLKEALVAAGHHPDDGYEHSTGPSDQHDKSPDKDGSPPKRRRPPDRDGKGQGKSQSKSRHSRSNKSAQNQDGSKWKEFEADTDVSTPTSFRKYF